MPINGPKNGIVVASAGGSVESWVKASKKRRNTYVVARPERTKMALEGIVMFMV